MVLKHCLSSQHSIPSPDGALIATIQQSSLIVSTYTGVILPSIPLPSLLVSNCRFFRWLRLSDGTKGRHDVQADGHTYWPCDRLLLADDDTVRVYDLNEPKWSGRTERASGNFGRIADVAFGHSSHELLVFSDFGVKLTIWSLVTSRGVEVRDPKYLVHCYSFRPRTGHMAVLTRPTAQDILMLLNPGDHELIKSVELPTVDAQEVAWSPDGRWLAIRDAASSGQKVLIYTADGHLFQTYAREESACDVGLGIKRLEWSPSRGLLALGDYNGNVTILSKNTFSSITKLQHPSKILLPDVAIWQEQIDALNERSYIAAPQPASPPTSTSSTRMNIATYGVSILSFNHDGSFLATKDDFVPTTIWIWSLNTATAVAVLIHHSPVKHVAWHPTESDLLLIHCAIPEPAVHLWKYSWGAPRVVILPLERPGGRLEANWLQSPTTSQFKILLSSTYQYSTTLISHSGETIPESQNFAEGPKSMGTGAEDMFDEGNSLDLSPIKITHDETMEVHDGFDEGNDNSGSGFGLGNEMVDDTFHYRRHVRAIG